MFNATDLHFTDIKTQKTDADSYIKYSILPAESFLNKNYLEYYPDVNILQNLKKKLEELDEKLSIVAFGAAWCPDCARNIPRLMKIYHNMPSDRFQVYYIGGIKTKPLAQRKPGIYVWAVPPSPPESADEKFDINHIPMFYIFKKDGVCIGRIIENPKLTATIEGDILEILNSH
jgi:thiol-disulfide isomerase/thioredoxin